LYLYNSIIKILIPWFKNLPFNGLEWSAHHEDNYINELIGKEDPNELTINVETAEVVNEPKPFY